jgi:cation diffusion facilitator family transporter
MNTAANNANIRFQQWITLVAVLLFVVKMVAWYLTHSVAVLTDALESIVNIVSAFIGLYSLGLSAKPKDRNHPNGHGKIEFVTASIEGTLIVAAGGLMIYEAIQALYTPHPIAALDMGIALILATAVVNYLMGYWSVRRGEVQRSPALVASGKHLQSDTVTTIGIIVGLGLIYVTKLMWLDSLVALIFAVFIIYTGGSIIRKSLAGIMDEADDKLLEDVVALLQTHRRDNWIDVHNLRIIKYGSVLHLDCHLTLPWYFDVAEAHVEVNYLENLIRNHFGEAAEMFVHIDGCSTEACFICQKKDCEKRLAAAQKPILWTVENVSNNKRHYYD